MLTNDSLTFLSIVCRNLQRPPLRKQNQLAPAAVILSFVAQRPQTVSFRSAALLLTEQRMANTILVGAQWGDEGKGKIIDVLTAKADIVVRSQGGNNAGHTVIHRRKKYILHLIPSAFCGRGKSASSATAS